MRVDSTVRRAAKHGTRTRRVEKGAPTTGQAIRHTPLTPEELAYILDEARTQRAAEDLAATTEQEAA